MTNGKLKATVRRELQESWYYIDRIEKPGILDRYFGEEPTKVFIKELTPKQFELMQKMSHKRDKEAFLRSIMPVILKFQNLPENLKEGEFLPKKAYKNLQQNYTQVEDKNKQKLAIV
ncbi:MAG: hypothetical protein AABX38_07730 [Candidatus Micrarchaeota archaeon]